MSRFRWSLLLAVSAQAAAIRGVVLDHASGRPLARSVVTLQAVQGYGGGKTSVRTGSSGQFVFSPLSAGAYLLSASRPGFCSQRARHSTHRRSDKFSNDFLRYVHAIG